MKVEASTVYGRFVTYASAPVLSAMAFLVGYYVYVMVGFFWDFYKINIMFFIISM